MTTRSPARLAVALLAVAALAAPASAAAPRDELLRLVPDDVAFCLVVQDLRDHAKALSASPFAEVLRKSPLGAALKNTDEVKKLQQFDAFLQKALGLDWAGVRDKLLGDAVVLAYRPSPPGKADQDQGLLLLRAQDAKVLADFVERLNKVQKESGDLKGLDERRHGGAAYFRRTEKKGETFYYVNGPVLAFTSQEAFLKEAIERDHKSAAAESAVARQLRSSGADKGLASLWVNPRAFDAEMTYNAEQARGDEAAVQKAFLRYWKALDGVALALDVQKDVRVTLSLRARTDDLPAAAKRFLAEAAKPSDLWQRFPDDALFAAAGRVDAAALLEMLDDFLTKEARATLREALARGLDTPSGKDFVKEVLPGLGPDCGLYLKAPPASDKGWFPEGVLAVRARDGAGEAMLAAVNFYAQLAVIGHNAKSKDAMSLKTVKQDKVEVKTLSGASFPPGLQPAYALKDGYLVLASSPEALQRFSAPKEPKKPADVPLLRLSAKELCRYLKERREPLLQVVAEKNGITKDEAATRLDGLTAVLQFIDRVEVSQRSEAGKLSLTVRVQTSLPLKE